MIDETGASNPDMISRDARAHNALAEVRRAQEKIGFIPEAPAPIELESLPELYRKSLFVEKLVRQQSEGQRIALFADIDQTFVLAGQEDTTARLAAALDETNIPLAYVTGRGLDGVQRGDAPAPDIAITGVGTAIWVRSGDGVYQRDEAFNDLLAKDWNHDAVYALGEALIAEIEGLEFQDAYKPGRPVKDQFKISFNFSGNAEAAQAISEKLSASLTPLNAGAIISKNFRFPEGRYYVDFLPLVEGKLGKVLPIDHIRTMMGIKPITAGDSANDLDMLLSGEGPAILVGNAQSDVRSVIEEKIRQGASHFLLAENAGPQGIIEALEKGDFNPEMAAEFVKATTSR